MVRYWCYRCLCTVVSQLSLFIYYSDCYAGIHVQSLLFTLDTVQSWLHIRYVTTLSYAYVLLLIMVYCYYYLNMECSMDFMSTLLIPTLLIPTLSGVWIITNWTIYMI